MKEEVNKNYYKWYVATDYTYHTPKLPGCYAIYIFNYETRKIKLIYIGTAVNLYKRLKKHEVKKVLYALIEYPELIMVKCKVIKDNNNRIETEKKLIARLKPKANII